MLKEGCVREAEKREARKGGRLAVTKTSSRRVMGWVNTQQVSAVMGFKRLRKEAKGKERN